MTESSNPLTDAIQRLDDQAAFDGWVEDYALAYEPLTFEGRRQDCKAAWDKRGALEAEKLDALRAEIVRLEAALDDARKPAAAPTPAPSLGILRCPRCGVDRTKEPCPGPLDKCPVIAEAQGLADGKGGSGGRDIALAKLGWRGAGAYVDSTPLLHVGDSAFEDWYQQHPKACTGDKQLARDAYAAGMGDPLVTYAAAHGGNPQE